MSTSQQAESEVESIEDFPVSTARANDTTAEEVKRYAKDLQAIDWEELHFTRAQYRSNRLMTFENYMNVLQYGEQYKKYLAALSKACTPVTKNGKFYDFVVNLRQVKSTIMHFQLRNLLWATSKHDIYLMRDKCINHWNLMSYSCEQVLNLRGRVHGGAPGGSQLGEVDISTLCAGNGLLAAGGFHGQLIVQRLSDTTVAHEGYVTQNENGITNALEIFDEPCCLKILSSNNDSKIRVFDAETFVMESSHEFEWPVNYSTACPIDWNLIAVVGDDLCGTVLDQSSNKRVIKLGEHQDYSFAAAWSPTDHVLATGNQDLTTRIWDLRKPDSSVATLKGNMGAIRSLRYSSDGRYLAMAEPADFVQIFDVHSGYQVCQEIDIFGEISGISFSPDGQSLFIGVVDEVYGSMLEYRVHRPNKDWW